LPIDDHAVPGDSHPQTRVGAANARSWLLVGASANAALTFDDARDSHADQIIIDLEDAVDPSFKDAAI
jgi:citrate lyase subunit beta/citryl-CoA lyase